MSSIGLKWNQKDLEKNPQIICNDYPYITPEAPVDAHDILNSGPHLAKDISTIVFSHLHYDHTGDCTRFPHAALIAGPGSRAATAPGFPKDPTSPFASSILDHTGFRELSFDTDEWVPIGPFRRAYDLFGDNSFLLLDAPGHMPGHLCGLAHSGNGDWVFMGGDCCHHRALFTGTRPISITVGPNGNKSFHQDPNIAIKTIELVRELEKDGRAFVALAHDAVLEGRMPLYPNTLNGWKQSQWKIDIDICVKETFVK